jgi:hypothetical protein
LPTDTLTLPSHGQPFRGIQARISQRHGYQGERLADVMDARTGSPCSTANILPIMFKRERGLQQTTFAMGEALAHWHLLWFDDKLQHRLVPDAICRFSAPAG